MFSFFGFIDRATTQRQGPDMPKGQVVNIPTRPFVDCLAYLSRMSSLTDFTPPTVRVTATAVFSASLELTKPLS